MTNTMTQDSRQNPQTIVNRVTSIGIIGNVILSLFKFLAGIFGHSSAMVSDAIHSLSDVLATFIAWLGIRLSMQAPDREHPYGHERLGMCSFPASGRNSLRYWSHDRSQWTENHPGRTL